MVLGFAPEKYAQMLIKRGAFGKQNGVSLSELASSVEGDVDTEMVRKSVEAISGCRVVSTDDQPEAYLSIRLVGDFADQITDDGASILTG